MQTGNHRWTLVTLVQSGESNGVVDGNTSPTSVISATLPRNIVILGRPDGGVLRACATGYVSDGKPLLPFSLTSLAAEQQQNNGGKCQLFNEQWSNDPKMIQYLLILKWDRRPQCKHPRTSNMRSAVLHAHHSYEWAMYRNTTLATPAQKLTLDRLVRGNSLDTLRHPTSDVYSAEHRPAGCILGASVVFLCTPNGHYWKRWFFCAVLDSDWRSDCKVLKNVCQSVTTTQIVILQAYNGMPISL